MLLAMIVSQAGSSAAEKDPGIHRDLVIKSWSTVDGLPSNQVRALAQTNDGYLWLGTSGGLVRFDGMDFVLYTEKDGIPRIPITKLTSLKNGGLWICNEAYQSFWLENGSFHPEKQRLVDVIVGMDGNLYLYDEEKIIVKSDHGDREIPSPEIIKTGFVNLTVTADGTLWLLQLGFFSTKVWRWSGESWTEWKGYEILSKDKDEKLVDGLHVTTDSSGRLWFGSFSRGCIRMDDTRSTVIEAPWGSDVGLHALKACRDDLMLATPVNRGIFKYGGGGFERIPLGSGSADPMVLSLLEGQGGEIWAGTEDQGLLRIDKAHVKHHRLAGAGVVKVTALWPEAPHDILVGTNGDGTFHWKEGVTSRYARDPAFDKDYPAVNAFWKSPGGALWMGTLEGLHEFREGEWLSGKEFASQFEGDGDTVSALLESKEEPGALWVGRYHNGLDFVKGRDVKSMEFPLLESIIDLEYGPDGLLWVATFGGCITRLGNDGQWHPPDRETGLPKASLTALHRDPDGRIWAVTDGGGLYRWDEGRFSKVEIPGPDKPENVLQIQQDDEGWLWLGTTRGIYGIDATPLRDGKKLVASPLWLGASDGMGTEQCTRMKARKDEEGRLYFGTTDGFVSFDPREVKKSPLIPRPVIEDVIMEGAPPVMVSRADASQTIPPGSRFEIHFTGLGPELAERMRFRYRLEGLNEEWVDLGKRRHVEFTQVPPGQYVFHLQAGARGEWNPQSAVLDLRVRPFYWQTWWFRALLVGAAVATIVLLVKAHERKKTKRLQAEIERKRAINDERERMSRDLHDSLGAGITHAGMLAAELSAHEEPEESALLLKERLRGLRRELDTAIWMTNPSYDSLPRICEYLISYSHEFLRDAGIPCQLDIGDCQRSMEMAPEARHHLFQATKEALNNIVKHAGARRVWIDLQVHEGVLRLGIRDNGRGFDPASAKAAGRHGLSNLRMRMAKIKGSTTIETSPEGTTVVLALPLSSTKPSPIGKIDGR